MKLLKLFIIPFVILMIISGCGASNKESGLENDAKTGGVSKEIVKQDTNVSEKIDLIHILFKSEEEVLSKLGKPNDRIESEDEFYLDYDGLTITFDYKNQKVIRMEIKSDSYLIAGTKLGQKPDDIRKVLGNANKEGISDELGNFEMIYNKEDEPNEYEMYFAASDFRSPIDYILVSQIITEPTYTLEEAKEMIKGKWILKELMEKGTLDTLTVIDDKNFTVESTYIDSQSKYRITASNVIEFPTYNSISDEHGWAAQNFEILEDGERLEIYSIDSFTGEIKVGTHKVYYKYSDLTN